MSMQYAKKMVLVPHETVQQAHTAHQQTLSPTYQGLSGLDEEMQSILRRRDMPMDERAKLYQQALLGYINMHQKLNQPLAVTVDTSPNNVRQTTQKDATSTTPVSAASSWTQRVKDSVPKTLVRKAEQLMRLIEGAPSGKVAFNEKGELKLNDQAFEGTHVVDLVNDVLRKRKTYSPRGWQTFAQALSTLHPPRELIGNEERWKFIQQLMTTPDRLTFPNVKKPDEKEGNLGIKKNQLYASADHLPPRRRSRPKRRASPRWTPY